MSTWKQRAAISPDSISSILIIPANANGFPLGCLPLPFDLGHDNMLGMLD